MQSHIDTLKRTKEVYEKDKKSLEQVTQLNYNTQIPLTYNDIISNSLDSDSFSDSSISNEEKSLSHQPSCIL